MNEDKVIIADASLEMASPPSAELIAKQSQRTCSKLIWQCNSGEVVMGTPGMMGMSRVKTMAPPELDGEEVLLLRSMHDLAPLDRS